MEEREDGGKGNCEAKCRQACNIGSNIGRYAR
jgi:hypothetical protein